MSLSLASCTNRYAKIDQNFGQSVNQALDRQKIKDTHPSDDHSAITAKEIAKEFKAYTEGKSVQSSSSNSLSGSSGAGATQ